MYIMSTGYNSYIFKPKAWLHNVPIRSKIFFLCIISYTIINFDYGILLTIYFLFILLISIRYKYKVYSKETKKIVIGSILLCLPLITYHIVQTKLNKKEFGINWYKSYYISICFQAFIIMNLVLQNFIKKEEMGYFLLKISRKFETFKLTFMMSNNFLKVLEKKIEILIYNWYNRDLLVERKYLNNFKKTIFYSVQFLFFELYYETIKFSLIVFLRKKTIKKI
uniref:Uncharacterized protein n=1 Tax=Porphyridium sordidum TaxID=28024 RepID=A0A1C9CDW3_PORSO|nr:hypothetical protein Psor_072 [Porphyridium sordidum]AOM66547.1 hypothetical protein Psor_072 [Porphyridium sordidum]